MVVQARGGRDARGAWAMPTMAGMVMAYCQGEVQRGQGSRVGLGEVVGLLQGCRGSKS